MSRQIINDTFTLQIPDQYKVLTASNGGHERSPSSGAAAHLNWCMTGTA